MTIVKEDFYDNGKYRGSYYYPFSKAGDQFGGGTATSVQPNLLAFTYEDADGENHPFKLTSEKPLLFDHRKVLKDIPNKGCCMLWTIITAEQFMKEFVKGKKTDSLHFDNVLFPLFVEDPKHRSAILDYWLTDEDRPFGAAPFLYAMYENGLYGMEKDHFMAIYSLFSNALPKATVLSYYQSHQEELERDISMFGLNEAGLPNEGVDIGCFHHFIGLEKAKILFDGNGANMTDEEKKKAYHFLREFIGYSESRTSEEDHALRLTYAKLVSLYGGPIGRRNTEEHMTVYDAIRIYAVERVISDCPDQFHSLLEETYTEYTYDADTYAVEDEYESTRFSLTKSVEYVEGLAKEGDKIARRLLAWTKQ